MKEFEGGDAADDGDDVRQDDEACIITGSNMILTAFRHSSWFAAKNPRAYARISFWVVRAGF